MSGKISQLSPKLIRERIVYPLKSYLENRLIKSDSDPMKYTVKFYGVDFDEVCSEQDVYACFRLILGRYPSREEWDGHTQTLVNHKLADVVATYLSSREFKDRQLAVLSETEHKLVDLEAFKMYVSLADVVVGHGIYATKTYEPYMTEMMRKVLTPGMVFVDLGANIGYFSMLAAHLVGEEGKVLAFEPFQYNVKLLYLNAKVNGFENVEIYPMAVSDKRALYRYNNTASTGEISEIGDDVQALLAAALVYSIRLDEALQGIDRLDVIKLDIEGAEYLAICGAEQLLKKHRPIIFSEFCPPSLQAVSNVSAGAYLRRLLIDEDYVISILDRGGEVIACQNDINEVLQYYENMATHLIDIVAYPAESIKP